MSFTVTDADFLTTYWWTLNGAVDPDGNPLPPQNQPAVDCLLSTKATELVAELKIAFPVIPIMQDKPDGPNSVGTTYVNTSGGPTTVPFLRFIGRSGAFLLINAGVIANWWNRGYDPTYAHQIAVADLRSRISQS